MAVKTRTRSAARRMPRDQRVAIIMKAALEVLRERGANQFLTSEVAARCDISEGTIYKYFPTKRDLLIRVAEARFKEFLDEGFPTNSKHPLRERLFQVIWTNLSIIRREPSLNRFVLMDLRSDPNFREMAIYQQNREIVQRVMAVIEEGMETGAFRSDIPLPLIRDLVFGTIEHQTWAFLRGEGDFSIDDVAEGITDILFRGIVVVPEPSQKPNTSTIAETLTRLEKVTAALQDRLDKLD